jgi:palmitoyl-protein thioesterase
MVYLRNACVVSDVRLTCAPLGPGDNGIVVPLRQSALYKEDWLGLKVLDESNRLQMHTSECEHEEHPTASCKESFDAYTLPLLRQPWSQVRAWRSEQ